MADDKVFFTNSELVPEKKKKKVTAKNAILNVDGKLFQRRRQPTWNFFLSNGIGIENLL